MSTVHDVRAARADRPLYQRLHRTTMPYVEHLLREKTATGVAALLTDELTGLRDFVLEELPERERLNEPTPAGRSGVRGEFAAHLQATLDMPARLDSSATRELAEEFSLAIWGTLLRRMRLGATEDGCISPADLFPAADGANAERRTELEEALEPFGISLDEAQLVLRSVLDDLCAGAREHPTRVQFPLGLWIDRDTLSSALQGRLIPQNDAEQNGGLIQAILGFVRQQR